MLFLRRPSDAQLRAFLETEREARLSYPEVGATQGGTVPQGYRRLQHRVTLGKGEEVYARAIRALYDWTMYTAGPVELYPRKLPVTKGATVAILARHFGFYSLNACRIVYKLDEKVPVHRCGFAIGTLPEHMQQGEERFSVEWDEATDEVSFELFAFVRARHLLAQLGFPFARRLQARFVQSAARAMQEAV
jgi:uncharacterized protein (UPF0548 family)